MKKRQDGRYQKTARVNGQKIFGYGRTPEEAEENLRDKLTRSTHPQSGPVTTLHDVAKELWYPQMINLAVKSKSKYEGIYRNHIRDSLGHYPPRELTFEIIQRWLNQLQTGDATKRFARDVLGQILKLATQAGMIDRSPTIFVKVPKQKSKRIRILSVEQAGELLEQTKGTPLAAPVFLAAILGLRQGEIAGLKWSDLDRQRGELNIVRQRQAQSGKGVIEVPLKTGSSRRTLRLTKWMIGEIDQRGDLDCEFIACRGSEPYVPNTIWEDWKEFRSLGSGALAPIVDWTFHDLRHGAAGLLHAAGCDLIEIAAVLGHATPNMSLLYTASSAEQQAKAICRLGVLLSS